MLTLFYTLNSKYDLDLMTWVPEVGMAKGQPAKGQSDDLLSLQFLLMTLMSVQMCV